MRVFLSLLFAVINCDPLTKLENKNRLNTCGAALVSKVFKGRETAQSDAPWSVLIQKDGTTCTGTVISSRHILTATHCFAELSDAGWKRIPGETYDSANCKHDHYLLEDDKYLQLINIHSNNRIIAKSPERVTLVNGCLQKVLQEKQNKQSVYEDLAIIDLNEELEFSQDLHPACIANTESLHSTGSQLEYYGFGINPPGEETGTLRHEKIEVFQVTQALNKYYFLAKDPNLQTIACQGDSGGGAVKKINGKWSIVGVLSQTNCAKANKRLTKDMTEMYSSVPYYSRKICGLTGICEEWVYNQYFKDYVRQRSEGMDTTTEESSGGVEARENGVYCLIAALIFVFMI